MNDLLNKDFRLSNIPKRIVSTVPSQTELLFDMGLDKNIVGITQFCVLPVEKTKTKEKVGGTKKLNIEKIKSLKPDLIIAGKEENEKEQINKLKKNFPVWISDVDSFDSALRMINDVALITEKKQKGDEIIAKIQSEYLKFKKQNYKRYNSLYFIWRTPYMVAGGDTFISDIMNKAGFDNTAKHLNRYPVLDATNKSTMEPEIILLCSEPYRFGDKHKSEFKELYPNAEVILTDGQMFTWYGSRMIHAFEYFNYLHKQISDSH